MDSLGACKKQEHFRVRKYLPETSLGTKISSCNNGPDSEEGVRQNSVFPNLQEGFNLSRGKLHVGYAIVK